MHAGSTDDQPTGEPGTGTVAAGTGGPPAGDLTGPAAGTAPAGGPPRPGADQPVVPRTRASSAWVSLAGGVAVLVIILVFILENQKSVTVSFFGASWRAPLAVDLLLAVVLGALVTLLAGTARIIQLRRTAKRNAAAPARR